MPLSVVTNFSCVAQLAETKNLLKPTMGLNQTPAMSGSDT